MIINKISNETKVPSWMSNEAPTETITLNSDRIQRLIVKELDEDTLSEEFTAIEKCVASKSPYYFNSKWSNDNIDRLKEYASIVGLDKITSVDLINVTTENEMNMTKTASVETKENPINKLKELWKDPFNIEEKANTDYMKKTDWEKIKKAEKITTVTLDARSVMSLKGGENYNINSNRTVAPGQNSITDPDAIGKLAKSTTKEGGEVIKESIAKRNQEKIDASKTWEKDKIDSMEFRNIVAKGKVFCTENITQQRGSKSIEALKFNPESIPIHTAGEELSIKNKENETIRKQEHKERWEKNNGESNRNMSDVFAESLKNSLKK